MVLPCISSCGEEEDSSVICLSDRCGMEPGRKKRAGAASGGGPRVAGGATPDASQSERAPGSIPRAGATAAGGGGRGSGAEPLAGVSGAEPPACLRRNNVPRRTPKSVQACISSSWHLCLRNPETGDEKRVPYECKSFRCPKCGIKVSRQDYMRISQAMMKKSRWVFMVLTIDRRDFKSHTHAYREICINLVLLRKRMERAFGKLVYLRVVEQHTTAPFPHLNFVFNCQGIFDQYPDDESLYEWLKRWLTPNARQCGFGVIHTASYVESQKAVSEYMAKAAIHSELSKRSQVPLDAPVHFRRIGATRGLLPPRKGEKTGWKGELIKSPLPSLTSSDDVRIITNTKVAFA